jgi:hypothetical protein
MRDIQGKHYRPHTRPNGIEPQHLRERYVPGIVLTADEACVFLLMSAFEHQAQDCQEVGCEVCRAFVDMWHSVYQALPADKRLAVETTLEDGNTRTPRVAEGF